MEAVGFILFLFGTCALDSTGKAQIVAYVIATVGITLIVVGAIIHKYFNF